jgi:hypothetical protein
MPVSVVWVAVPVNVVHTSIVPAFVRVLGPEAHRDAVSETPATSYGIIVSDVPVQPPVVAFRSPVSKGVLQDIEKPCVIHVHA